MSQLQERTITSRMEFCRCGLTISPPKQNFFFLESLSPAFKAFQLSKLGPPRASGIIFLFESQLTTDFNYTCKMTSQYDLDECLNNLKW